MASVEGTAQGWWAFVLLGVCAGVLSGMLGVGSGTVIIPGLILLLSVPQKSAQGMCLAAMIPMVAVGAVRYKLNPDIEVNMVRVALLALGGVAGAFAGVEIVTRVPGSVLRRIFACFIIAVGLRMLVAPAGARSAKGDAPAAGATAAERTPVEAGAGAGAPARRSAAAREGAGRSP